MSTNVFGNLYVVGYGENRAEDLHGLVGKVVYYTTGTTVDMFRYIIDQTEGLEYAEMGNTSDVDPEKINLQQATEGSEIIAFMADAKKNNKECYGVLGEPQVTACKAKVEGSDFIVDFQEEWKKLTGEEGYPQASLVVKSEFAENHADVAEAFANSLAGNAAWLENADNIARFKQADELARQLRLRDMGGIIVVDFIDMNEAENRQKLYERMCANMQKDRARHNILPLSKFGLMQITRQRVRPAMDVNTTETCPTCFGKGTIKSSILFTDTLESKIDYLVNKLKIKKFSLHIHPYIAAYVNQGLVSLKRKWQMKYGFGIKIIPNQKLAFLEYVFYDLQGEEIDMKEEIEIK